MAYINVSKKDDKSFSKGYFVTTILGLAETVKVFFEQVLSIEKSVTVQWPEVEYQYSERFKGAHFLTKRPDGQVRCTACFLCATNCPAQCIHIEAGQSPDGGIEKYPVRFEIDILRCVFCGFCEEACPVDAIRLGPEYSMSGEACDQKWVYTKDYLLDRDAVKKQVGVKQVSKKEENVKDPSVPSNLPNIHQVHE